MAKFRNYNKIKKVEFLTGFKLVFSLALIFSLGVIGFSFGEVPTIEANTADQTEEMVWIDGKLPAMSKTKGEWFWDENMKQNGVSSHTSGVKEAARSHSFRTDEGIGINKDSRVIQYVFLDPKDSPSGIMMKFFLNGASQISAYWEGEEEVFADTDEYLTAWYMGPLPKKGEWARLEIDFKELDIKEEQLEGICFIRIGGRLWWGRTVIVRQNG